jgi:hypothetical protein
MTIGTLRKRFLLSLILLAFSASLFVGSTISWITQLIQDHVDLEVGLVDVNISVFFVDVDNHENPASEVQVAPGVTKPGVYLINIVENGPLISDKFDDFRVHIEILSNVDTYFRVKIYEQLTLTYINYEGNATELSVINPNYMPFNYATTNWYDNRTIDNYIYYRLPVQRNIDLTPLVLDLIATAPVGGFSVYSPGYSLQIAFSIEAVQATGGPANVWNLTVPPWGSTW